MNEKLRRVLVEKFGETAVNEIVKDGEIKIEEADCCVLRKARDHQMKKMVAEGILTEAAYQKVRDEVENGWGFDFPGWLGKLENSKRIMIIGQEPNIQDPYFQIVYGLFQKDGRAPLSEACKLYKDGQLTVETNERRGDKKLWYRVATLFSHWKKFPEEVLMDCYITDLCHFAPYRSGTEKAINKKLEETQKWIEIRRNVLQKFLIKELQAVNPKVILCQGNPSFQTFRRILTGVKFYEAKSMSYPTKRPWRIKFAEWRGIHILGVPHLGSNFNISNSFWQKSLEDVHGALSIQGIT